MTDIINYFVTDKTGLVVKSGSTQESHLDDNRVDGTLHMGTAPLGQYKYIDGKFVPCEIEVSYRESRSLAYPSQTEQLDMLWHAMESGEFPKAEPFYSSIKMVKEKFPKTDGNDKQGS